MKHTLLSLWLLSTSLVAQDARPVAFTNARILTLAGPVIDRGTLVAKNGTITAVGADVAPPAGAIIVDCAGGTLMPGLVSAFSRAGFAAAPTPRPEQGTGRRGRRGGGPQPDGGGGPTAENRAATKIVERLDPKQDVFDDLLAAGVTTLALTPPGNGFPGLGAILRPDGRNLDALTQDDDAFVFVGMARNSQVKKVLKEGFEQAKKIVEARKKPKEEPKAEVKPADASAQKPAEPAGNSKDAPKPPEPKPQPEPTPPSPDPKPEPKPEPETPKPQDGKPADAAPAPAAAKEAERKDPNLEVLADLLEGKRRAVLQIDSAADLLHWIHACGDDLKFPRAIAATRFDQQAGTFDAVLEQVKKLGAPLLLPPDLSTVPRSRVITNPVRTLHEAGVEVGFVLGDSQGAVRQVFFRLMELVRAGLPAEVALRGVTVVPSKVLGIESQVGTLEVGKKANLLLFSTDPLYASSELRSVWLEGKKVEAKAKR